MDRELIQDYLRRAEMQEPQAEALSRILADMATKSDLQVFQEQVDRRLGVVAEQMAHLRTELTGEMARQRAELTGQMARQRAELTGQMARQGAELTGQMAQLRADLMGEMTRQTRWMVALIVIFGTVITIVNAFVG